MQNIQVAKLSLLFAFLGFVLSIDAQVRHSQGQFLGKSSELTSWKFSAEKYSKSYDKKDDWKSGVKSIPNFKNHGGFPFDPDKLIFPQGADKAIQENVVKSTNGGFIVQQDYDGIDHNDSGVWPPDCNGDIGLQYYIMSTNGSQGSILHFYDKITGELVEETLMGPLWAELGAFGAGDPVIWFDRFVNRWFLTEFTFNNSMLVAVSETSDPLGAYNAYEFFAPSFPDYPHFGSWDDGIYITTNEPNGFNPVYAFDREAMVNGEATATFIEFDAMTKFGDGSFFQVSSPIDFSGTMLPEESTNFMAIRIADDQWDGVEQDMLQYYEFAADFTDPESSTIEGPFDLITQPFKSDLCNGGLFDCIEMSNGGLLSVIPTVIMNKVQYRNFGDYESILLNFAVDITGDNEAGVRWFELRKAGEEPWSIYQESTYTLNDGTSRFMGSMSQDSKGNILMGYAIAGKVIDPSVGVTGRRRSDPLNTMSFGEEIIIAGEQASPIFRWGDYFSMTVDPQDDQTFWLTSEYMPSDQDWATRLTAMTVRRDTIDAQVSALISPVTSSVLSEEEIVSITVSNPGFLPVENVPWTVFVEGVELESGVISDVILPLESIDVTLTNTADLSAFGTYNFVAYTSLEGDENPDNDTLRYSINHIPAIDIAAVQAFDNEASTCSELSDFNAIFVNEGFEEVTSFEANLYVNDVLTSTILVMTSLQMNQSENVVFSDVLLTEQFNTIRYEASNINGQDDQIISNDAYEFEVELVADQIILNLAFETDEFAAEVSWEIIDEDDVVVISGGNYTGANAMVNRDLCLKEACYTFRLNDSFGDGWNFGNNDNKFLEIKDEDGNLLVVLDNFVFGTSWTAEFCVPFECQIEAEIEFENSSAPGVADASILISLSEFLDGAMYSIDGGENFQESPLFTGLLEGEYEIVVINGEGCPYEETISILVDIVNLEDTVDFTVSPNPSFGMLKVHIAGYDGPFEMKVKVVDQAGKLVSTHRITKFSDGYRATLLMPQLPSGLYFMSVQSNEINLLRKFVKQ